MHLLYTYSFLIPFLCTPVIDKKNVTQAVTWIMKVNAMDLYVICTNLIVVLGLVFKAIIGELSSDTHQLQLLKLHHFKL